MGIDVDQWPLMIWLRISQVDLSNRIQATPAHPSQGRWPTSGNAARLSRDLGVSWPVLQPLGARDVPEIILDVFDLGWWPSGCNHAAQPCPYRFFCWLRIVEALGRGRWFGNFRFVLHVTPQLFSASTHLEYRSFRTHWARKSIHQSIFSASGNQEVADSARSAATAAAAFFIFSNGTAASCEAACTTTATVRSRET